MNVLSTIRIFAVIPLATQKLKGFQRQKPLLHCPGTVSLDPPEAPPLTPIMGSRSALAVCVHLTFLAWRRPCCPILIRPRLALFSCTEDARAYFNGGSAE